MIETLKKETKKTRKKVAAPVPNTPVLVISRVDSPVEFARINPNDLTAFATEHKLDVRACESIIDRTYVNHEGFTFKMEEPK